MAFEALRSNETIQEIAAKHQMHPNQVSTWRCQVVEVMAGVFALGVALGRPTHAEVEEVHAKMGGLAVEDSFYPKN